MGRLLGQLASRRRASRGQEWAAPSQGIHWAADSPAASVQDVRVYHCRPHVPVPEQPSVDMAQRFGKLFGNGPELWVDMQKAVALWETRRNNQADYAKIRTLKTKAS